MFVQKSILAELYAGPHHPIDLDSPELRFLSGICERRMGVVDELFFETKLFRNLPSAVDAPFGRYEGLEGIRRFVEDLYARLESERLSFTPVVQTRANGRVVSELVLKVEGEDFYKEIPMFWVGDLRTADTLDEVRVYCHHTYIPGLQAYRKPIFPSAHLEMGDPNLLTGAVREYYEVLHHVPQVDVPRILNSMEPDCVFGGYNPNDTVESAHVSMKDPYTHMATYIPRCVGMRYETIIDDGVNCTIEWQHVVSRAGREELSRIAIAGISTYERGKSGKLCSIRICDYAGYEKTIDWTKTPVTQAEAQSINFVEEFPAGCGRNPQS